MFAMEELVGECRVLLNSITLQISSMKIRFGSQLLCRWNISVVSSLLSHVHNPSLEFFLDKDIVSMFVWRLLRNRLPIKDNLFRWDVLNQNSQLCVGRCGASESANHLFLKCNFFSNIWQHVQHWIDFSSLIL